MMIHDKHHHRLTFDNAWSAGMVLQRNNSKRRMARECSWCWIQPRNARSCIFTQKVNFKRTPNNAFN